MPPDRPPAVVPPDRPPAGRQARAWRLAAVSLALACAAMPAAGCSGGAGTVPAPAHSAPAQSAPAGAASAPARALAARYLAIAQAGNRRLEHDFDGLKGRDHDHLAAAQADLRDVAATERLFDRRLLAIAFPPRTEQIVRLLFAVNQARAGQTAAAATATSLSELHAYQQRLDAANGPVEDAVTVIRSQLGLPPPATS